METLCTALYIYPCLVFNISLGYNRNYEAHKYTSKTHLATSSRNRKPNPNLNLNLFYYPTTKFDDKGLDVCITRVQNSEVAPVLLFT